MKITSNIDDLVAKFDHLSNEMDDVVKETMYDVSVEIVKKAQDIIENFTDSEGHSQGVDSGNFINGIHETVTHGGFGYRVSDSVSYGIYHEYGTIEHWLPFFDENGSLNSFGEWALRNWHFSDIPRKSKAKRMTKIEELKRIGGIKVQLDEMAPFRQAAAYGESIFVDIFNKNLKKRLK